MSDDKEINKAVQAIFEKYDTDKSGTLELKQLQMVVQDIFNHIGDKRKISEEDTKKVLKAMDKNQDGKISPDELKEIIKRVMTKPK